MLRAYNASWKSSISNWRCLHWYATYFRLKKLPSNINPVVSITVNHENCDDIQNIFYYLVDECNIDSIKCTIVRDEGVYKTPQEKRLKIFNAYTWLTEKILEFTNTKVIGIDRDIDSKNISKNIEKEYKNRFLFENKKFSEINNLDLNKEKVKAIVFDLGYSYKQIKDSQKGLSFD